METLLSLMLGIGLSAACGFRMFVPFFAMSIAAVSGHLDLASGFDWIGTYPALITFAVATCIEVAGYYIPFVDELLDVIETPFSFVAGTVLTASTVIDMSPLLKWTLAIVAGGGIAGVTKGLTGVARLTSTLTTAGLGNPLLSTMELGTSATLSILALTLPLLAGLLALGVVVFAIPKVWKMLRGRSRARD